MDLKESYKILELETTDSFQEIKQAYRDIIFVWHPDRLKDNDRIKKKAAKKLAQINLAYETLQNHLASKLPNFTQIIIHPKSIKLEHNESQIFTVFGIDEQKQEIEIQQANWQSSGGTIYQDGLFFADDDLGKYEVKASFRNHHAQAKVAIVKQKDNILTRTLVKYLHNYQNQLIDKLIKYQDIIHNFLSAIKWLVWGVVAWTIMTSSYIAKDTSFLSVRIMVICLLSWLISIFSPHLAINFGIDATEQASSEQETSNKVSVFYAMLTSIFCGFSLANNPFTSTISLNFLQNWVLGVCGMTMLFTLAYPQGSPMGSMLAKTDKQNRFTVGLGCFILGIFWILLFGLFKS